MDHPLDIAGWQEQWLTRDFQPLHCETIVASYAITIAALGISLRQLWNVRRARKLIDQGGDPATILAESDKKTKKAHTRQHRLSWLLICHSLAIWLVDAGIGIWAIQADVSADPSAYDSKTWLNLAIYCLGLFTLFTSVLIVSPMVQFVAVGKLLHRHRPDATSFSTLLPQALTISHQLAYLWCLIGFIMVSWWSTFEYSVMRVILLEAAFGSGLAWMHVSTVLTTRTAELSQLSLDDMSIKSGVQRLYCRRETSSEILPMYAYEKVHLLSGDA